jgi:phosphatidylglycerol---prolipoprotein diacylglyceryl transferase
MIKISPHIFTLLSFFSIRPYGLCLVSGIVVFMCFFIPRAQKELGLSLDSLLEMILMGTVAGVVGARLLYVFEISGLRLGSFVELFDPRDGGLSVIGSLLMVPAVLFFACRYKKVPVSEFLDIVCLYAPIVDVFGRLGCFFAGCCYGLLTNSWVAVIYVGHVDGPVCGIPLIPIQIFTALLFFILLGILVRVRSFFEFRLLRAPGFIAALYFLGAGLIRFFVDFWRGDRSAFINHFFLNSITWYQGISLCLSFVACFFLITSFIQAKKRY